MKVIFFGNGFDYSLHFLRILVHHPNVELLSMVAPLRGGQRVHWRRLAASLAARLPGKVQRGLSDAARFPAAATALCQKAGARLHWPDTINDPCLVDELFYSGPDLVVMAGFNEILKKEVLSELPPIINVHPSLLPAFRGPNPEFWTVAHGAQDAGVTIHFVERGIDTGPIVAQERFVLEPWLTGGQLQARAMRHGGQMLERLLGEASPAHWPSWTQSGQSSYQHRVSLEDVVVPFELGAVDVYNRARAADPWLPLYLFVPQDWWTRGLEPGLSAPASRQAAPGMVRLELRAPVAFPEHQRDQAGTVRRTEGGGISVACGQGTVFFGKAAGQ